MPAAAAAWSSFRSASGVRRTYLGVTPDNLMRVTPLYNLLLQLVIDVQTRRLPEPHEIDRQLLIVLDEFARLGHAPMLAHGFSFVAGYGIRLLAVLQSPSQLRATFGDHLADEIMANCGAEVIFAPKDVRVAQALSERLGYMGQPSMSRSRPPGLAPGRRSVTESEQRRALMLPQELIGLSEDHLIVLRSGIAPVRGRKLRYYRQSAFKKRVRPAPQLRAADAGPAPSIAQRQGDTSAGLSSAVNILTPDGREIDRDLQSTEQNIHRR